MNKATALHAQIRLLKQSKQTSLHALHLHCTALTVKGVPNRDSSPNVSSGKETPISEIAIFVDEIPIKSQLEI